MSQIGRVRLVKNKQIYFQGSSTGPCNFESTININKQTDLSPYNKTPTYVKLYNSLRDELDIPINHSYEVPNDSTINIRITTKQGEAGLNKKSDVCLSGPFLNCCSKIVGRSSLRKIFFRLEASACHRLHSVNMTYIPTTAPYLSLGLEPELLSSDTDNIQFTGSFMRQGTIFDVTDWSIFTNYKANLSLDFCAGIENLGVIEEQTLAAKSLSMARIFQMKLLNVQYKTDTTIVLDDGSTIGCHKLYLSSQSPVFREMLRNINLEDQQSYTLKIPNMSKSGIWALLQFLYFMIDDPTKASFETVLELLNASKKYEINRLKTALIEGFLKRETSIQATNALGIFCFTRNAPGFEALQSKAVDVLKTMNLNLNKLLRMEEYKKFSRDYPEVAGELCDAILQA